MGTLTCVARSHVQAEVPGQPDKFLVFPFGLSWSEVTASNLLTVDEVAAQTLLMMCGVGKLTSYPLRLARYSDKVFYL